MTKVTLSHWIQGSRPRTLSLSIVPVVMGIALATKLPLAHGSSYVVLVLLCLLVALLLQIGVNFANDYSDGIRGTDKKRVGPLRLVGSGLVKPRLVLIAALSFFAAAALAGLIIIWLTGAWWLLAVGVVCLLAAWFYTGGKHPYGYAPFGELAVLLFFGLVPTLGTVYVLSGTVDLYTCLMGLAAGSFAAAVLLTNNLRDREKDAVVHKRTLSVLIGDRASRWLYAVLLLLPFALLIPLVIHYTIIIFVFLILLFVTVPLITQLFEAKTPPALVRILQQTSAVSLLFGFSLAILLMFA